MCDNGHLPPSSLDHAPGASRATRARLAAPRTAATIGRHVKAALLHLCAAEDALKAAGVDLDRAAGPEVAAMLWHAAYGALADLDTWAATQAHAAGVGREAYAGTERWCHTPGGTLPYLGAGA